MYSTEKKV